MKYPFYGCKMKQVNTRNDNEKNSVLSVRVIDSVWHVYRALTSWPVMLRRQNIKCREGNAFRILSGYDSFISKSKMCRE